MKKILLIALAALPLCVMAAPTWETVAGNAESEDVYSTFEIDVNSVARQKDLIKAWVRFSASPQKEMEVPPYKRFGSYISMQFFDCVKREYGIMRINYYAGVFGEGGSIHSVGRGKESLIQSMDEVIPGTLGEGVLDAVCKIAKSKVATKDRKKSR